MKRLVIFSACFALISGLLLKGNFVFTFIVLCLGLYVGAPLALFMALWGMIGIKRSGAIPEGLKRIFPVVLMLVGALLCSLGIGYTVHCWDIHRARGFVAGIIPKLDDYRIKHGIFPHSLTELGVIHLPSLLNKPRSYTANSSHFAFEYYDDLSGWGNVFDSDNRCWQYFD